MRVATGGAGLRTAAMPKAPERTRASIAASKTKLRQTCLGIGSLVVLAAVIRLSASVALAPVLAEPPVATVKLRPQQLLAIDGVIAVGTEGSIFTMCLSVAVMEAMNLVHGVVLILTAQKELPSVKFLSYWSVSYLTYHCSLMILVIMYVILLMGNEKTKEGLLLMAFEVSRIILGAFFVYSTRQVRTAVAKVLQLVPAPAAAAAAAAAAAGAAVRSSRRPEELGDDQRLLGRMSRKDSSSEDTDTMESDSSSGSR